MTKDRKLRIVTGLATILDTLRYFLEHEGCAKAVIEGIDSLEENINNLINEEFRDDYKK